jgi:hypothetical protein
MKEKLLNFGRRLTSKSTRRRIIRYTRWPPVGWVQFGSLRRLKPIGKFWGAERGQPIDRYYIENFLAKQKGDISGRVLEIGDNTYTIKFGGDQVDQSEILHVAQQRQSVTIIGDLTRADQIPTDSFDCIILTQTLQTILMCQQLYRQ